MEKKIDRWEDCYRDDLNCIPLAIEKGWTPVFNSEDKRWQRTTIEHVPHNGVTFTKGNRRAWQCYKRIPNTVIAGLGSLELSWAVGDVVDGQLDLQNIKKYVTLKELFETE